MQQDTKELSSEADSAKRKRVTRACDSCNALRTKCDGGQPCKHCMDTNLVCEFNRVRRKRGKVSRREAGSSPEWKAQHSFEGLSPGLQQMPTSKIRLPALHEDRNNMYMKLSPSQPEWPATFPSPGGRYDYPGSNGHDSYLANQHPVGTTASFYGQSPRDQYPPAPSNHEIFHLPAIQPHYAQPTPNLQAHNTVGNNLLGMNRLLAVSSSMESPSRSLHSPSTAARSNQSFSSGSEQLKYPVLIPHLAELSFLPPRVLCDLLETYFDHSAYVLGYVLKKSSVLHPHRPRKTSTALIYAMLCVAAHTCESPHLGTTPVVRAKTVQRLFEMSVTALRPLQHDEVGGGGLDDVITYMQLGTIIAASEFKGVSLRWLHAAWTLAKELRLNREVGPGTGLSELTREERRRTWWLLYIMDRHLCLCYNKPLLLTDVECAKLYQPLSEEIWDSDHDLDIVLDNTARQDSEQSFETFDNFQHPLYEGRRIGPLFEIQGPGIFGFFLPLMTILGEICTIFSLKNHHHLLSFGDLEAPKNAIREHLREYEKSLTQWSGVRDEDLGVTWPIFTAYASQLMHTLYVLLCGKWDPIDMLEDEDSWISSDEFVQATTHAVNAAEAVQLILTVDRDLAYMPFFFGIYLLQGSFLLLLIVDKLEQDADDAVIQACESYVRAHEVCVVTLETQYQRNFRIVMRKTLNSVRHKVRSTKEERSKRRELLTLYRWANDGRGLVI